MGRATAPPYPLLMGVSGGGECKQEYLLLLPGNELRLLGRLSHRLDYGTEALVRTTSVYRVHLHWTVHADLIWDPTADGSHTHTHTHIYIYIYIYDTLAPRCPFLGSINCKRPRLPAKPTQTNVQSGPTQVNLVSTRLNKSNVARRLGYCGRSHTLQAVTLKLTASGSSTCRHSRNGS
jgi:hypothetical protein